MLVEKLTKECEVGQVFFTMVPLILRRRLRAARDHFHHPFVSFFMCFKAVHTTGNERCGEGFSPCSGRLRTVPSRGQRSGRSFPVSYCFHELIFFLYSEFPFIRESITVLFHWQYSILTLNCFIRSVTTALCCRACISQRSRPNRVGWLQCVNFWPVG